MYTLTSNHIRERVAFEEGKEKLVLQVDIDPLGFVDEMRGIMEELKTINDNSTDEDYERIGRKLSTIMFGEDQTEQLYNFYHRNTKQFFNMVTRYFVEHLNGVVIKKQKKMGRKRLFK